MVIPAGKKRYVLSLALAAALLGLAWWGIGRYVPLGHRAAPTHSQPARQGDGGNASAGNALSNDANGLMNIPWETLTRQKAFLKTYKLKRRLELLGFQFTHLEHRKIPQQFIIAEHVPRDSSDLLFSEKVNIDLVTLVSNQLLALRKQKKEDRLSVEKLETTSTVPVHLLIGKQKHTLQHRQVVVTIRLASEARPRRYIASLVRYPAALETISGPVGEGEGSLKLDTVVVTFAKPEAFKTALLSQLLNPSSHS